MADQTKYKPSIAWHTIAANVYQLTRETVDKPATYQMNVSVIDSNEIGQGQKDTTCYFTDYIGNPYSIIATSTFTIDVEDSFRVGCPTTGRKGIIHKSAYKGYSLFLPSESLRGMHPIAAENNNKFSMSILWANDPNGRRIPFSNVLTPRIADYRSNLVDENGITFNPMEDYGQNPQFDIFQINEDGTYSQIFSGMNITINEVDGLIDSILFSGTGEEMTGYILIKN